MKKKDYLIFLGIITVLLAVIAWALITIIRSHDRETDIHNIRSEAQVLCQLEAQQRPTEERQNLDAWIKIYEDCVIRRSGAKPPEGLRE